MNSIFDNMDAVNTYLWQFSSLKTLLDFIREPREGEEDRRGEQKDREGD